MDDIVELEYLQKKKIPKNPDKLKSLGLLFKMC